MVRYSMGDIDCFFQTLKPYSPLKDFKVPLDESTIIPFYEYISQIKNHMDNCLFRAQKESEQAVCSANNRLEQAIQNLRKRKRQWVGACIAAVLCCIGLGTLFCGVYKYACDTRVATAQTELQAMQKNFQHVDAYGDPYLQLVDGLIQVFRCSAIDVKRFKKYSGIFLYFIKYRGRIRYPFEREYKIYY